MNTCINIAPAKQKSSYVSFTTLAPVMHGCILRSCNWSSRAQGHHILVLHGRYIDL